MGEVAISPYGRNRSSNQPGSNRPRSVPPPLTPWGRFKAYVQLSDTAPSEFFSLMVRFWWGVAFLLQSWTNAGLTAVDRQSAAPLSRLVGEIGVGVFLIVSGSLHAYSILWDKPCLRRWVLLTVVFWWVTVTMGTLLVAGPGVRALMTALFGLMMAWAYWRRSPSRGSG